MRQVSIVEYVTLFTRFVQVSTQSQLVLACWYVNNACRHANTTQTQILAARGLEELFFRLCHCVSFWLWQDMIFGLTSIHRVQYMMAHRNRYSEETEDGQMTPHGYPSFNSYIKNQRVLVFRMDGWTDGRMDGWTDGRTDRQTDRQVWCTRGWVKNSENVTKFRVFSAWPILSFEHCYCKYKRNSKTSCPYVILIVRPPQQIIYSPYLSPSLLFHM